MTTEQMWNAIERLASVSHSVASENQRIMKKAFEATKSWRKDDPLLRSEPSLPPIPVPELETGRIMSESC